VECGGLAAALTALTVGAGRSCLLQTGPAPRPLPYAKDDSAFGYGWTDALPALVRFESTPTNKIVFEPVRYA
jgi:hypothetical protein